MVKNAGVQGVFPSSHFWNTLETEEKEVCNGSSGVHLTALQRVPVKFHFTCPSHKSLASSTHTRWEPMPNL